MDLPKECYQLLDWIDAQQSTMELLVEKWANVNSGSNNLPGLSRMHFKLLHAFNALGGKRKSLTLPPSLAVEQNGKLTLRENGTAFLIRNRQKAPLRILLGGHMDTVFDKGSPFQKCRHLPDERLEGPGVSDMKGGLVVMLYALLALEKSSYASNIGWDVLITPDEETGSSASAQLWKQYAWQNHVGVLFEPAYPDGAIVSERKGSMTYYAIAHGKKAHAGRDFHLGKNAVAGLAEFIRSAHALNSPSVIVNVGQVHGGEAANIIPDEAFCSVNVRADRRSDLVTVEQQLREAATEVYGEYGVAIELHLKSRRPPKVFDSASEALFAKLQGCAEALDIPFKTISTGGVCDGNLISAEGVPTIDTLGVIGGDLHTTKEWIWLPSLSQRARLAAAFLLTLAIGAPSKEFLAKKLKASSDGTHE